MEAIASTPLVMSVKWVAIPASPARRGHNVETYSQKQCDSTTVTERLATVANKMNTATKTTPTDDTSAPSEESSILAEPTPWLPHDGSSCSDIYNRDPESRGRSGVYLIRVEPKLQSRSKRYESLFIEQTISVPAQPFPVYCEMGSVALSGEEGGWTLVYKIAGSSAMASPNEVNRCVTQSNEAYRNNR